MVVFITGRTATHPEARFDRVKDCFERTCRSENCAETAQNGLKITGSGFKREQDGLKLVRNGLRTTLNVAYFRSTRCSSVVQTVCNRNALTSNCVVS